jgi:hypothetical protein
MLSLSIPALWWYDPSKVRAQSCLGLLIVLLAQGTVCFVAHSQYINKLIHLLLLVLPLLHLTPTAQQTLLQHPSKSRAQPNTSNGSTSSSTSSDSSGSGCRSSSSWALCRADSYRSCCQHCTVLCPPAPHRCACQRQGAIRSVLFWPVHGTTPCVRVCTLHLAHVLGHVQYNMSHDVESAAGFCMLLQCTVSFLSTCCRLREQMITTFICFRMSQLCV